MTRRSISCWESCAAFDEGPVMARPPRVAGLVLCEALDLGTGPGQVSFMRLFQGKSFPTFPTPRQAFVVYTALQGERQEGTIQLVATHLETEADVYRLSRWQQLPGSGMTVHVFF